MGPGAGGVDAALVDRRMPLAAHDCMATLRKDCLARSSSPLAGGSMSSDRRGEDRLGFR